MATGFLFKANCYPTLAEATSAYWSSNPVSITPGATSYFSDVLWSGTAWQIKKYTMTSAGVITLNSTTALPAVTFESCDTKQQFTDGMALGWGVAAAMVAVFVIKAMGFGVNR